MVNGPTRRHGAKECPQGLKPRSCCRIKSELKLRPPKEHETQSSQRNRLLMVLDIKGRVHRGNVQVLLLKRGDFGLVYERQPDIVEALEQAIAAERIDGEGISQAFVVGYHLLLEIDGHAYSLRSRRCA